MSGPDCDCDAGRLLQAAERVVQGEAERLVDRAIAEGRIGIDSRDGFLRAYGLRPDDLRQNLDARPPDFQVAQENLARSYFTPENEAAFRQYMVEKFDLTEEEVV